MDRLKKRDHVQGEPELVTREDGTQMVRVRKHKRRTNQPHRDTEKRKARARVFQIAALVGVMLCCSVLLLGLLAYFNSHAFQMRLLGKIAAVTGAEPEVIQFRVTPVGAAVQAATLRWHNHPDLRELRLTLVNADLGLTSFLGGGWTGEEVLAHTGTLIVGEPGADDGAAVAAGEVVDPNKQPFQFGRYRCEELQVLFGQEGRPPLQARGVEASVYQIANGLQLRLSGGSLSATGWPDLRIDRGLVEFVGDQVNISNLRFSGSMPAGVGSAEGRAWGSLLNSEESAMECSGSFDPRSSKQVFLDVNCQRFPSDSLLGKSFSRLFTTVLDGRGSLSFVPRNFASHELVLPFEASAAAEGACLGGLPFLDLLKTELQEARFAVPQFQNGSEGVLRRRGGLIELSDLRLEQKNFLAVRGRMAVEADGKLVGSLEVGVANRLMSGEGTRYVRRAFTDVRDGYRWTHINLSGTVQSPKDDFGQTLKAAYQAQEGAGGAGGAAGSAVAPARDPGHEFEELIRRGGKPPPAGSGH